jgi:hypothetical protein
MRKKESEIETASSKLKHTLSSIPLPGRVGETDTKDKQANTPAFRDAAHIRQPQPEENTDYCQIPESFSQEENDQRRKLILDFLNDIQATVRAQVCSIFLINENGHMKRDGIIGFDKEGLPLDESAYGVEEYPLDGTSAVGITAQSTDGRYGHYLYIESVHDNSPDFVRKDKLKEQEAVCGRIDPAVFVPIHGPNSSYGVLRVFNKVSKENNKPIPNGQFTSGEQIYLAQAAAYLGSNLRELRKNQDQEFSLTLQNNILLKWAEINQQILSSDEPNERVVHQEILSNYQAILKHLAQSSDSYAKSAILRLIRPDNRLWHVTSYTRQEDDYRNNDPRVMASPDWGAQEGSRFTLVGKVAKMGTDILIRDINSPDHIGLFVNQNWIASNCLQDFFCIALKVNGDTIGTLSLFTGKNRCLALEDLRYLKGVANSIGLYTSLIFSSPYVRRGKINQKLLDRFLQSIHPSQAINLDTLLSEDATSAHTSYLATIAGTSKNAGLAPRQRVRPISQPEPLPPAATPMPLARDLFADSQRDHGKQPESPSPTEPILGRIFLSHSVCDSKDAKILCNILFEALTKSNTSAGRPKIDTSLSKPKDLPWSSFQTFIILLSDQCSTDNKLRTVEWVNINTEIWSEPQKRVIPIRLSGKYLPAFLSKFNVLNLDSICSPKQSAALILSYPSAELVEECNKMDDLQQSEMVRRYTEQIQAMP